AEMDKQRKRFVDGAVANGVQKGRAEYIFELVAKFAGYGFNKSHAAAYALIAYQTAYLKANYPSEFVAASMTLDMGNADKLNSFAQEARRLGIKLEQPSVNHSEVGFIPNGKAIRYSLAALKNVGQPAVESIVAERNANGLFGDISDFARRLNPRHVNKRALETLSMAGAFDELGIDRATALENVDRMILAGNSAQEARAGGQNDLFFSGGNQAPPPIELRKADPWLPTDRLAKEFDAVGFFLTGHPLDEYSEVLKSLGVETWTEFSAKAQTKRVVGRLAGTVLSSRERKGKTGNPYAFVAFLLEAGSVVLLDVEAEAEGENVRVRVQGLSSLDNTAEERSSGMKVTLDDPQALPLLAAQVGSEGGQGRFQLRLLVDGKEVEFDVPQGIDSTPRQRSALKLLDGVRDVSAL
ncbi:MAG: DNA polymerase III subunit alpha, partial [Methyloceanibacter sp.]